MTGNLNWPAARGGHRGSTYILSDRTGFSLATGKGLETLRKDHGSTHKLSDGATDYL